MKKLLGLTLALLSLGFIAPGTEAQAAETANAPASAIVAQAAPQVYVQRGWGRRYNRRVRIVTQTRIVQRGRQRFRETYQIRYLPNGRTQTTLISRVRIR